MGRRAEVRGATVAIPLDGEAGFGCGSIVGTTQDGVVLRAGGNSLRVLDAQAFCAGHIRVRHVVELPQNVNIATKHSPVRFGAAWDEHAVYCLDFQTGGVAATPLPMLDEPIADAFVSENGGQIVVVGSTSGKLYGWSQCDRDYNEELETWNEPGWRIVDGTTIGSQQVDTCSCGQFANSALLGNSFIYLRATRNSGGCTILEKWIFDVDSRWSIVHFSSKVLSDSCSDSGLAKGLTLFIAGKWEVAVLTIGSFLCCMQVDQDLSWSSVRHASLDQPIIQGTWINGSGAFAMLLSNGQISVANIRDTWRLDLLVITTSSMTSKRLSLTALVGKAVSTAFQLVHIQPNNQIVVDFGASCSAFHLEIFDDESPSAAISCSNAPMVLHPSAVFARSKVSVNERFDDKFYDINTSSSHDIEESQFTSTSELLEVARVSLTRSHTKFHDIYFVLLCTVHQLLAAVSVSNGKSEDPIDCIGKSLRLMEVLVTLTMSMDANIIRQVSSKMLSSHPGSVSRYEQRRYYSKEILAMSQQLRKSFRGMNDTEEWWLSSTEATTFLQVYFTITCALFQKIMAGPSKRNQNQAVAAQISSLCRHLVEQEENIEFIARKADGGHDSLFDDLKLLLASYTMICCCLEKSGVEVDLEHIFSINIPFPALSRKEVLCCFLRLWTRQIGDYNVVNDQANETFNTVVQVAVSYAFPVGALPHLMKFALASRSSKINSCLQAICTTAKFLPGGPIDDVLHWQACETYVSECVSILKQMGIRRQFKYFYREAGCNSEAPQFPFDKGFSGYYETLSAAIAGIPKRCSLSTSPLWEFSHHDKYLRARVINLIARITWHLEACASGISSIFQQAFMINCFETSSDTKDHPFHDSVSIARKIITPQDTELHLPMFQQSLNPHPKLPFRSQKIARSLVLIAWILWLREKAAYCSRYYRLLKNRDEISTVHEIESLGDLAATCALHLHTLGTVSGGTEELLNVQLSLLEKAVAENPIKCATILAWGFPACKISTRYIKRYKALRLDIPNLPTNTCLEERELEYRNIQNHIRQGFQHAQGNQNMSSELNADDIDVLFGCCCDQECLQILSALAKVPFEAAITKVSTPERIGDVNKPANEAPPAIDELVISSSSQDNPNPALICTIKENMEPQISESLISRDEVIALLQAQTRHLEEEINAVTIMDGKAEYIPPSRIEYLKETEVTLPQSNDTKHDQNITTPEKVVSDDAKTELLDLQRIARISLQVRDLNRHRYASANAQSSIRVNQNTKPAERHDSVRNALKLFHLRRESGDRLCMGEKSLTRGNRNRASHVEENVVITATSSDDFLKCNNSKRTSGQTKSTKNTRRNQSEHFLPREPVCPLRHEYGIDSASLKLLSRSARHRNLSIKKKLFVQQDCERVNPAKLCQAKPKVTINFANSDEVLEMKSASAQTNKAAEVSIAPIDREVSNTFYREENDISPGKSSPVTQEFSKNRPVVCPEVISMNRGVGIQCRVSDDRPVRNLRKKRGPPQLNIAEKFPIWVDLDVANSSGVKSHFKERKRFLQVARFSGPSTTTNNDENPQVFTISPSGSATVSRKLASEDGSEENQSDGKQSPSAGHTLEDRVFDGINEVTMAKYRSSYRQQYPIKERSSVIRDDRDSTSGIDTLIGLRDDMHRMTHRLWVLETCANSIDEEFRVSQKRLSRIGDKSSGTTSLQTQVLQDIDEVLETTQESDRQAKGLLSKKASNDLDAAKKLLETIEQLTIRTNDRRQD